MTTKLPLTLKCAPLLAVMLLTGCASFHGVAPEAKPIELSQVATTGAAQNWPARNWWEQYGDAQLNQLENEALSGNIGLQQAQARIAGAQAAATAAGADRYPQVGAEADTTHELFSKTSLYPPPFGGSIFDNNNAFISAKYEFDFWNKNGAALQAALSKVSAAQAEQEAARAMVSANVAKTYFALARLLAQQQVLQSMLEQRAQTLSLVQQRVKAGLETRVEQHLAESNLPVTRGDVSALTEQIGLTRNALAVLLGRGADATRALHPTLNALQAPALPEFIPADLLAHRPDIAAAKARVEAARSDTDVAKALFYPNINFSAMLGFTSLSLSHWLEGDSTSWGVGPAISLPIFEGGRLRANLRGKNVEYDAAVLSYNQAVLDAAREVSDQIVSWKSLQTQQKDQTEAQKALESAYQLAKQRYQAGLTNYLAVLQAENAVLAQRRAANDLKARALELSANLAKALGAGYKPAV